LLPFQILQLDIAGIYRAFAHISRTIGIFAQIEVFAIGLIADYTPSRTQRQHAEPRHGILKPRLLTDIPSQGECGEVAPTLVRSKLRGAIAANREVGHVAAFIRIVGRISQIYAAPPARRRAKLVDDTGGTRSCDGTGGQTIFSRGLRIAVTIGYLPPDHHHERVVFIIEVRGESQCMRGRHAQTLVGNRCSAVLIAAAPSLSIQGCREESIIILVENIKYDLSFVGQSTLAFFCSQQLVIQFKLRFDIITGLTVGRQVGDGNRIELRQLVTQLRAYRRQDVIIVGKVAPRVVLLIDREVGHTLI